MKECALVLGLRVCWRFSQCRRLPFQNTSVERRGKGLHKPGEGSSFFATSLMSNALHADVTLVSLVLSLSDRTTMSRQP